MLDFTPEYLSDSQLSQLAESFALCLKPHGAILVANSTHLLHKLESILQTHNNGVITTIRGTQKLASLLKTHFKITSIGIADHHELITLTLKGSQYPTFIQPQYPIEYGEDSQISRQLRIIFQKYKSTLPNYPTT